MSFLLFMLLLQAQAPTPALENDYVRVMRDEAPCASASTRGCGDRVIVALGLFYDFRELKKPFALDNPSSGKQRSFGEPCSAAG